MNKNALTKYEITQIIGIRAEQLARGALPLVDTDGLTDLFQIAEREMNQKKLPFKVVRSNNDIIKIWA
jgi:DNA-directed RNA polymerase subunit K/omega